MSASHPPPSSPEAEPGDRLDSWKEIAAYLKRDVTTVQRWEKREGMPVHRHQHDKGGSVYAFRTDLDAWSRGRSVGAPDGDHAPAAPPSSTLRSRRIVGLLGGLATLVAAAVVTLQVARRTAPGNPLERARFLPVTDFEGIEQAAAISRDGRFVAFQSDRDGRMDVWVTQLGTGEFLNLTRGSARELVNPSVRTLGFSPDGNLVTFWAREDGGRGQPEIGIWAATLLGGPPRRYLDDVAELDWSRDGARVVYHTPGPGDPMFVRESGDPAEARNIFSAPPGLHGHFPTWSPDQAFVYFVQGSLPDHLDIWRIRPTGGRPERLTKHDALVSHPVFLDARTLLYLATDPDGAGPCIYSVDVVARKPRRVSFGTDTYTSLAASADGRRVVATRASPKRTLWRAPIIGGAVDMSAARKIPLTTANGSFPRVAPDYLLYVSSKGTTESVWKLEGGTATELWSEPDARILGAPAIRRDGRRVAFSARQGGRTKLYVMNADGTQVEVVTRALEIQGAPAWAPDGQSLTVSALEDGVPRLFDVPLNGGPAAPFLTEHSLAPVWAPGGDFVAYSGADIGTTFAIRAANADGSVHRMPGLTLTRGARRVAFTSQGRSLLVLKGEIRHKDLWLIDLVTGLETQVTRFAPGFDVRDFDLSPDGSEVVLEQVQEHSDIVLIEMVPR